MFPVDSERKQFRQDLLKRFNTLFQNLGYSQDISDMLPNVIVAGEIAGYLTKQALNSSTQMVNWNQGVQCVHQNQMLQQAWWQRIA